jgi:hypothetical protein
MLELNVTLNKTTHQTMHIALLQTCLKWDLVYVVAEVDVELVCVRASYEMVITSPLGAEMLQSQTLLNITLAINYTYNNITNTNNKTNSRKND